MKVSNRNFYQVMEGAEQRMQLHYKVFAAELGWLRAHLGLVLRVHPRASLRAAVACAFGKAVWKAPLLWRYHRYGFTNSTFASLSVWSVSSWFFLPWFLWVQTRWWLCVCLLWYVQSLALLPTQSLNVSSHHPSYHSDPSFQTHYSHETYAGVENELWKRGQANTPESQELPLPPLWVWPDEWIDLLLQPKMLPSPVTPNKVLDTWRNCERQCYKASTFRTAEVHVLS